MSPETLRTVVIALMDEALVKIGEGISVLSGFLLYDNDFHALHVAGFKEDYLKVLHLLVFETKPSAYLLIFDRQVRDLPRGARELLCIVAPAEGKPSTYSRKYFQNHGKLKAETCTTHKDGVSGARGLDITTFYTRLPPPIDESISEHLIAGALQTRSSYEDLFNNAESA